jgi:hypothetical protein
MVFRVLCPDKTVVLDVDNPTACTVEVKVSGTVALFLQYTFMVWTGKTLPF